MPQSKRPSRLILRFLEELTETSYASLFGLWAGIVVCFSVLYLALSELPGGQSLSGLDDLHPLARFGRCLYFSVITSTTVGYGDVAPRGISQLFASIEAVFAYFVFAIFVSKLVSNKTEMAVQEVHALMFENKYHNTREGLFTIRKDFDAAIREAKDTEALSDDTWEKIVIACWEGHRLIQSASELSGDHVFLRLDSERERLLLESVHRTVDRLSHMLSAFDAASITWRDRDRAGKALGRFLNEAAVIAVEWQKRGHKENAEWFKKLQETMQSLKQASGS